MSKERLTKLVLMLSSDSDGEVINAARAITRLLPTLGMDWHSFAANITTKPQPTAHPFRGSAPAQPQANQTTNLATPEDVARLQKIFNDHMNDLRTSEAVFIKQMVMASRIYKGKMFLSLKQKLWLQAIHARVTA